MAEKLARMYGTEEDKVNCPFYFKIGACRYGDKCLRIHNKPPYSQTLLIKKLYTNLPFELALASGNAVSEEEALMAKKHLEEFYEDIFFEFAEFGEIDDLIVCDNIGEHLLGAVYVKYVRESDAMKCMENIRGRFYQNQQIMPEYSPVTDFSNAKCKQFIENQCKRGGFCNYMHLKPINSKFKRKLFKEMYEEHPEYGRSKSRSNRRSRSRSHRKKDKKSKHHKRSRSHKKDKKKRKHRDSRSRSKSPVRSDMNSEERRAMIAQWNEDSAENNDNNQGGGALDKQDLEMQQQMQQQYNPQDLVGQLQIGGQVVSANNQNANQQTSQMEVNLKGLDMQAFAQEQAKYQQYQQQMNQQQQQQQ